MTYRHGEVPSQKGFACLTYHIIGDATSQQYAVREEQFRTHLSVLRSEGYTVEGFEQLEARLRGTGPWPERYLVLTIDDGDASSMRAAEILAEVGAVATFFVTRNRCLHKAAYIRESDIRELRRRGFSLGTHGVTHEKLTFMPEEQCIQELRDGKAWLEQVLGEQVRYTAAPGGFVNRLVLRHAAEQGYVLTATCKEWMNLPESIRLPGNINRVNIRRHFSTDVFKRIIEGDLLFFLWRQARAATLAVPKQLLLR